MPGALSSRRLGSNGIARRRQTAALQIDCAFWLAPLLDCAREFIIAWEQPAATFCLLPLPFHCPKMLLASPLCFAGASRVSVRSPSHGREIERQSEVE